MVKLCTPAWVYLFISVFALLWNMSFSIRSALLQLLLIGIWTYVLDFVCKKGYTWVSWVLVLAPYVFAALVLLIAIEFMVLHDMGLHNHQEGFVWNKAAWKKFFSFRYQ